MSTRTTILLDPASRRAAKTLAARLDVSPSEAIRRAGDESRRWIASCCCFTTMMLARRYAG